MRNQRAGEKVEDIEDIDVSLLVSHHFGFMR